MSVAHTSRIVAVERLAGRVRIALVIAAVIGALWADRGRPEPVSGAAADIEVMPDHAGQVDSLKASP